MLTAKFANNTQLEYLTALETEEYWGGSSRRTLTIECAADAMGLDALNTLLTTETNTADIILTNSDTGAEAIHSGYQLKLKLAVEPVLVTPETPESPAVHADRLIVKLGQRTYTESQMRAQSLQVEAALAQATYTAMMSNTLLEG